LAAIVVVDNGSASEDKSLLTRWIEDCCNSVVIVSSAKNGGFGFGMNLGIAKALEMGAECILLLNNDTIVDPGAIVSLQSKIAGDGQIGVVVPVVTTGHEGLAIWAAGGSFDEKRFRPRHLGACGHRPSLSPRADDDLSFAPGAALLVRREVLLKIGGFVEGFFLYFEDVEFSRRVTGAGFRIVLAPDARVWHAVHGGHSARAAASVYYRTRNALWLARRDLAGWRRGRATYAILLAGLQLALQKGAGKPTVTASCLKQAYRGARDGLLKFPARGHVELCARMFA
jgi:GT2 family glycosyltransferase